MRHLHRMRACTLAGAVALACSTAFAQPTTPAQVLAAYQARAGVPASAERGQALFTRKFKGTFESCTACHTPDPLRAGRDEVAEKAIAALAPAANRRRFTDTAHVENHFRLNCKDVLGRECTAGEKADIVAWLISLKP